MKKIDLRFWRNPRWRYGGMSTLLLCIALAALVALNGLFTALEDRFMWRVDYSFNRITSYSAVTEEVLSALDTPVTIYAMWERGYEDPQLQELLNRYCAASSMVTWEQTPLSLYPSMATAFQGTSSDNQVTSDCLIVYCAANERFRVLTGSSFISATVDLEANALSIDSVTYENALTAAISYVTQETIPVVYMIQGHDETDYQSAALLNELLLDSHYDVRYTTLAKATLQPEDVVVFLSPQYDLTTAELEKLAVFINAGGSLLFSASADDPINGSATLPTGMPNYRELLRLYGFIPLDGMVWASASEAGTYDGVYRYNLYADLEAAEVTFDMMLSGATKLYMPLCRAFETPLATSSVYTASLLTSGEQAYLHTTTMANQSISQSPDDPTGPFTLGMEAYRFSDTGDVSRAVMLGSTAMLISETAHSSANTRDFILHVMDYLTGGDSASLNIAPKVASRPALSADALTLGSVILVALPLCILAAALLILYPRRHL